MTGSGLWRSRVGRILFGGLIAAAWLGGPPAALAVPVVYVDAAGGCDGHMPCFTTIQAGVNNATKPPGTDPAFVSVFPGVYNESVDFSTMGSAVAGTPDDILVGRDDLVTLFTTASAPAPALQPPASSLPPKLVQRMVDAQQRAAELLSPLAPSALPANAAGAAVTVMPPGGPAFRNSVSPFPGSIEILGIEVVSPNDRGIDLTAGDLFMTLVNASGNFGDGMRLSSNDFVDVALCTLNGNGGSGASLTSTADEVQVLNSHADMNMQFGFDIQAADDITIFRFPFDLMDFPGAPQDVTARNNKLTGFHVTSSGGSVSLLDLFALLVIGTPPGGIVADGNQGDGITATALMDDVNLVGVQANGNKGNGASANPSGQLELVLSVFDGNDLNGVTMVPADGIFALLAEANGNKGSGMTLQTTGANDQFNFSLVGGMLLAVSANGNGARGIDFTATGGPVVIFGSMASGNTTDGLRLRTPTGSQSYVNGGVLCDNQTGLRLDSNSIVNAEGNWWGSKSGPFHATKNPGGTGNPVVDGTSGGGSGDVDFLPVIDTVTGTISGPANVGSPTPVTFQFSGGGGTVFLGLQVLDGIFGGFGPGAGTPFSVSTDNGLIRDDDETGPSVTTAFNQPNGKLEVELIAFQTGHATVTVTGPCGLSGSAITAVQNVAAPALSGGGLLAALSLLTAVAGLALRRRQRTKA